MALKHVLMLVFILTLLKQFQSNMSDTEVGTCECLYFETRQKKLSVIAGM